MLVSSIETRFDDGYQTKEFDQTVCCHAHAPTEHNMLELEQSSKRSNLYSKLPHLTFQVK